MVGGSKALLEIGAREQEKWSVNRKGMGVTEARLVGFDTSLATGGSLS